MDVLKWIAEQWPWLAFVLFGAFGYAALSKYVHKKVVDGIDDHKAKDHAIDAVKWEALEKTITNGFGDVKLDVHDVKQSVKAVHKRLDDHIDSKREDRSE